MTEPPAATLAGLRVLVVEDQMLIAMDIETILHGLGCVVMGPAGTVRSAVRLARDEPPDAAILDVNLDGETVFPVADELQARGIPFVFATGYGESALPERWRGCLRLRKPFGRAQLEKMLSGMFGG